MKKQLLTLIAAMMAVIAIAQEQAPAFPGAEGHGRYVTGGRKTDGTTNIIHVTNLNNNGTGSLRWALSDQGLTSQGKNKNDSRTIVFDIGGVIELSSNLTIPSNTTIAGQTAPYPGITIRYYTVTTEKKSNIIVRFIRFRLGQEKNASDGDDAANGRYGTGIIFDHCSFSWSVDEIASFYDNNNFTLQWSTVCEALHNAGHTKGNHGYGGIWGGKLASFHHNLIAHMRNRSPRFNGARYQWNGYTSNKNYNDYKWANSVQAENVDLRNCIIFNGFNGCYGGPGGGYINIVNNYYKRGTDDNSTKYVTTVTVGASGNSTPDALVGMTSRYFIKGNKMNGTANADWNAVNYDDGTFTIDGAICSVDNNNYYGDTVTHYKNTAGKDCVRIKVEGPTAMGSITTHTADNAFEKVLAYAGASDYRDREDTRYTEEARTGTVTVAGSVTGTKGQIDLVKDIPEYANGYVLPDGNGNTRPANFDTDSDGIPDEWETANGLNPNDKSDGNLYTLDSEKKWYTNLEVYLNSLVESIMKAGMADGESNYTEYWPVYQNPTAISAVTGSSAVVSTTYYDLQGRQLSAPQAGINICVTTHADGHKSTKKIKINK